MSRTHLHDTQPCIKVARLLSALMHFGNFHEDICLLMSWWRFWFCWRPHTPYKYMDDSSCCEIFDDSLIIGISHLTYTTRASGLSSIELGCSLLAVTWLRHDSNTLKGLEMDSPNSLLIRFIPSYHTLIRFVQPIDTCYVMGFFQSAVTVPIFSSRTFSLGAYDLPS